MTVHYREKHKNQSRSAAKTYAIPHSVAAAGEWNSADLSLHGSRCRCLSANLGMLQLTVSQAFEIAIQHQRAGRLTEAEALYLQVVAAHPNHYVAYNNLGLVLANLNKVEESLQAFDRATQAASGYAEAYNNRGVVLATQNRLDEAAADFRNALQTNVNYAEAWNNLGTVLRNQGLMDEAVASYSQALRINPSYGLAYYGLGNALQELTRIDEAMEAYRHALKWEPNYDDARVNYASLLLLRGDFELGFQLYESRWRISPDTKHDFQQPRWNGNCVGEVRVLVHAEQGFGDSIQFVRYVSLIRSLGCFVIIECPRPLAALFRTAKGVGEVIPEGDPLPPFDAHIPMLSLPLIFRTTPASIPKTVPYLFCEEARLELWQSKLAPHRGRLRVGIVWTGNPHNRETRKRQVPLSLLAPVLEVESVAFFNLQIGPGADQMATLPLPTLVQDYTNLIRDFADTAAFIATLDLVVAVDTAVAHLAGALGRPVWTLLPFAPDWRWGLGGETTPWYPTMRLFRQPALCDWNSVIRRVAEELKKLADSFNPNQRTT